jgi:transcription elongation factor Elf1
MIKVDSQGREFCLPCADKLEIEGVIVERGGSCIECANTCADCDAVTKVTIEPYGTSHMATIECPNCGVSYDTNLDPVEGASA